MSNRFSRWALATLVVAVVLLSSARTWAMYNVLGPSKDEWGIKYDVQVNDAGGDTVTVVLTVADEGRLKPFYSVELIALSKDTDSQGGHGYDVKAPIVLKPTADGRRAGQVKIRKEFLDHAQIRILTDNFDNHPQKWLANYEVPIRKFMNQAPGARAPLASPPSANVTK